MTLLHTALRVSELLSLNYPKQFKDGYLLNIQRKGKKLTRKLRVPKPAQTAIREYLKHERGKGAGPLFQSKTGKPLAVQNVNDALKKIAAQANSTLPAKEQISVSPHVLRHTALRKWTEKKGVRFAQKIAGHATERYIWRYITPSDTEIQDAVDDLWS